jgi:hypothetical protein
MKDKIPAMESMCGTCDQPTLWSTRLRYIHPAIKYTTKATPPIIANTPKGDTLLEAWGGEIVGQA